MFAYQEVCFSRVQSTEEPGPLDDLLTEFSMPSGDTEQGQVSHVFMMIVNTQDNAADGQSQPGRDLPTGNDQPMPGRDNSAGIPSPAAIPTDSSYSFPSSNAGAGTLRSTAEVSSPVRGQDSSPSTPTWSDHFRDLNAFSQASLRCDTTRLSTLSRFLAAIAAAAFSELRTSVASAVRTLV